MRHVVPVDWVTGIGTQSTVLRDVGATHSHGADRVGVAGPSTHVVTAGTGVVRDRGDQLREGRDAGGARCMPMVKVLLAAICASQASTPETPSPLVEKRSTCSLAGLRLGRWDRARESGGIRVAPTQASPDPPSPMLEWWASRRPLNAKPRGEPPTRDQSRCSRTRDAREAPARGRRDVPEYATHPMDAYQQLVPVEHDPLLPTTRTIQSRVSVRAPSLDTGVVDHNALVEFVRSVELSL